VAEKDPVLDAIDKLALRFDDHRRESRERDVAQTERTAKLDAKIDASVATLTSGMTTLSAEVQSVKTQSAVAHRLAAGADEKVRVAAKSYHDLEVAIEERTERLEGATTKILTHLSSQDEEFQRSKAYEREERRQESLAVKRLAEERKDQTERQRIWSGVLQGVLVAAITASAGYLAVRAGHQNTEAKLTALSKQVESLPTEIPVPPAPAPAAAVSSSIQWGVTPPVSAAAPAPTSTRSPPTQRSAK
jgi:hypothetical protein